MAKIVFIDDEYEFLFVLTKLLENEGHEVVPFQDGIKAIKTIKENTPDLVITDIMMPGVTGGAIYNAIRKEIGTHLPIIVCSASHLKIKMDEDPLLGYSPKPVNNKQLFSLINSLIEKAL